MGSKLILKYVSKKYYIGAQFKILNGETVEIIGKSSKKTYYWAKVLGRYKTTLECKTSNIDSGHVSNPLFPSVFGMGYRGKPVYGGKPSEKRSRAYVIWANMLGRAYNPSKIKSRPTYLNVEVCDEWLNFSIFEQWVYSNFPYHLQDDGYKIHLDKDILSKNSGLYSPNTCIFIPAEINTFLTNKKKTNTSGYVGVSIRKGGGKYKAATKEFGTGRHKYLGEFDTALQASVAYNEARLVEVNKVKDKMKKLRYRQCVIDKIE